MMYHLHAYVRLSVRMARFPRCLSKITSRPWGYARTSPLLFATVTRNARSDVYFRAEQAFCLPPPSPVSYAARLSSIRESSLKNLANKKQAGSPFNPVPLPFFRLSFASKPAEFFNRPARAHGPANCTPGE